MSTGGRGRPAGEHTDPLRTAPPPRAEDLVRPDAGDGWSQGWVDDPANGAGGGVGTPDGWVAAEGQRGGTVETVEARRPSRQGAGAGAGAGALTWPASPAQEARTRAAGPPPGPPAPRRGGSPLREAGSRLWRGWMWFLVPVILGVAGVEVLGRMNANAATSAGLIAAFPLAGFVILAALTVSFVLGLWRAPHRGALLYLHVLALIILLYGAGPLSEHEASLGTTWYHVGFVEQIFTTGSVLHHADARWSWPGFFAGVASLLGPAGMHTARTLILWTPVALMVAYSLPLVAIGRALARPRPRWLGLWLFFMADWTGQEYFSPQGFAFFLFLALLAVVVTYLRRTDRLWAGRFALYPRSGRVRRAGERSRQMVDREDGGGLLDGLAGLGARLNRRRQGRAPAGRPVKRWMSHLAVAAAAEPSPQPVSRFQQAAMLGVVLIGAAALTVSHQLTPVALMLDLFGLALVGRLSGPGLPIVLGAMIAVYISYLTTDFWVGHFSQLIGIGGGGGGSIQQNVGGRISGDLGHKAVVYLRLLFTAGFWLLAALGTLRRYRLRRLDVTIVVAGLVPLSLPILQPYGGEALIRAFLYGLPFVALLVAFAFMPGDVVRRGTYVALTGFLILGLPLFVVVKYGNVQFERMRPGEVAAVSYVYSHAPANSVIMVAVDNLPWKYQDITKYGYAFIPGKLTPRAIAKAAATDGSGTTYVLLSESQQQEEVLNNGATPGFINRAERLLDRSPLFEHVLHNAAADVYKYVGPNAP